MSTDELAGALPLYLSKSTGLEVHLRDRSVRRWKTAVIQNDSLHGDGSDTQAIPLASVALIRIEHPTRSRLRRIAGGVAGFLIGSLVGGTIAIGVSDAHGKDGLATAILIGSPIAGAWVGQRIAKRPPSFTIISVSPVNASALSN
jgi:hypothetical protein